MYIFYFGDLYTKSLEEFSIKEKYDYYVNIIFLYQKHENDVSCSNKQQTCWF